MLAAQTTTGVMDGPGAFDSKSAFNVDNSLAQSLSPPSAYRFRIEDCSMRLRDRYRGLDCPS
jgi:hypothetical protein